MIRIYGLDEHLAPRRKAISDTVHRCMVDVLGMPENKRAQRFIRLERGDFFMPEGRTDAYTVIEMCLIEGRKMETRKQLIRTLFARFESQLGIAPADLEITISERPAHDWGFRGKPGDELALTYKIDV
ncbi:MAG: tautomerase family protein [Myxococcales bacterium]|nr:tautomerase family protein [Myxococcales bacterium]